MKESKTTIHIGMPKSASTLLQKGFLDNVPDINFASHEHELNSPLHDIVLMISRSEENKYDESRIREIINHECNFSKPTVLSSELFVWNGITPDVFTYADKKIIAQRLKSLFPDAQILIIIRNQIDLLKSLYCQLYAVVDFSLTSFSFDKWIDLNLTADKQSSSSFFNMLDYYETVKLYTSLFPSVKVFVFEEIIKNFENFIKNEFSPLVGIKEIDSLQYFKNKVYNKRHAKSEMFLSRNIKRGVHFLQNYAGYPQRIIPLKVRENFMNNLRIKVRETKIGKIKTAFAANQEKQIIERLKEGNNKLADLYNIDLKKYNYPL